MTIEPNDGPMNLGVGMKSVSCVTKMVSGNAVIVFGRRGCCACHVVMRLLPGLSVNPTVFEVDEEGQAAMVDELSRVIAGEDAKKKKRPDRRHDSFLRRAAGGGSSLWGCFPGREVSNGEDEVLFFWA